jgi:hypothetical protein
MGPAMAVGPPRERASIARQRRSSRSSSGGVLGRQATYCTAARRTPCGRKGPPGLGCRVGVDYKRQYVGG